MQSAAMKDHFFCAPFSDNRLITRVSGGAIHRLIDGIIISSNVSGEHFIKTKKSQTEITLSDSLYLYDLSFILYLKYP